MLYDLSFYGASASAVVRSHKIRISAWDLEGPVSACSGILAAVSLQMLPIK